MITEKLCFLLDKMAPIKLKNIKSNKKQSLNLSKECRRQMTERDKLKKIAKRTNSDADWNNWKKSKNKVNKLIRKEKSSKSTDDIIKVSKDKTAKGLWNMVKRKACWTFDLSPTTLKIDKNEVTSSPVKKAHA